MLLYTSVGGIIRTKNEEYVHDLIERMCHNEHLSTSERDAKRKGVLELDSNTTVLAQIEMILKQLARVAIIPANFSQVQTIWCDFCRQRHANGNIVLEGYIEEAYYAGKFQRGIPFSNTYNAGWNYHSNVNWSYNQGDTQVPQIPLTQQ